jgi:hypothetical protein
MATDKKIDAVGPKAADGVGKATVETKTVTEVDIQKPAALKNADTPFNPAKAELPVLMGRIMQACLYDRTAMPQAKRDLTVWYNAQPLENRKETARDFRRAMETAKLVTESLYSVAVEVSMGDA